MKILLTGGEGQLGTDLSEILRGNGFTIVSPTHKALDITDYSQVEDWVHGLKPDIIVNAAAYHLLDMCEREPQRAFSVNSAAVRNLAIISSIYNSLLIHISTDYVFSGTSSKPYVETDITGPLSVYANSKLSGEYFVQAIANKFYIIRTCGLYGHHMCRGKGKPNFVNLILKIAEEKGEVSVVDDEILTPTYTEDLAHQILYMIKKQAPSGLYHVTNSGFCSWYEFTREIFDISKKKVILHRTREIGENKHPLRPKYSVLKNQRLIELNLDMMPNWQESLSKYINSL